MKVEGEQASGRCQWQRGERVREGEWRWEWEWEARGRR